MPTYTFYPDAHPETSSVDGEARFDASLAGGGDPVSFTTLRTSNGNDFADEGTNFGAIIDGGAPEWVYLSRGILVFDTSSIPDDYVISSVTLSLYAQTIIDPHEQSVGITQGASASSTAIAEGDYQLNTSSTRFCSDILVASIVTNAYTDFVFNASGIAAISKTGVSKFAVRLACDIDNSEPATSGQEIAGFYSAENGVAGRRPKLTVVADPTEVFETKPTGSYTFASEPSAGSPTFETKPTGSFSFATKPTGSYSFGAEPSAGSYTFETKP